MRGSSSPTFRSGRSRSVGRTPAAVWRRSPSARWFWPTGPCASSPPQKSRALHWPLGRLLSWWTSTSTDRGWVLMGRADVYSQPDAPDPVLPAALVAELSRPHLPDDLALDGDV